MGTAEDPELKHLIGITEPDASVYRIYPMRFFRDALEGKRLALISPQLWEDPYEIISSVIAIDHTYEEPYRQEIINQDLPPVFAQCWSRTHESDTLLRAYSRVVKDPTTGRNTLPSEEGVQVRSTPRKLVRAVLNGAGGLTSGECYVGSVQYRTEDGVQQELTNAIGKFGPTIFAQPINRARVLLLKRNAFAHEDEVRLIYVPHQAPPERDILSVTIDPAEVFEEIIFDPRLGSFERIEREQMIRGLGFTGSIRPSYLYQRTVLQVILRDKPPWK